MPFIGQKRNRPTRTLSVRGPETFATRLSRWLKNRGLMGRVGLCLIALLLMLAAVQSWRVPFPYREGQRISDGVAAKIDFQIENEAETERLRRNEETRAPFVFQNNPQRLESLPENLRAALVAIEPAESIDQLDEELRNNFGLSLDSGNRTESEQSFEALKEAVSQKGQIPPAQRINRLVDQFDKYLQPLRTNGVISDSDIRKLKIGVNTPLVTLASEQPSPAASTALVPATEPEILFLPQVNLRDMLAPAGELGDEAWQFYPELSAIRSAVTNWLTAQKPDTLRYDDEATRSRKSAARASVEPVFDSYVRGDVVVTPDEPITQQDLRELEAEYEQIQQQLGTAGVLLRIGTVFFMLVVLAALNGSYIARNEPALIRNIGRLVVYLSWLVVAVALGVLLSNPWQAEVVPLVITVMVFAVAYNPVFATLTGFTLSLILTLATTSQLDQFIILMSTAAAAAMPLAQISSRTTLIRSGLLAGLAYLLVFVGLHALQSHAVGTLLTDRDALGQCLKGAVFCVLCGYIIWGSLPLVESTFGVLTDISLLEMSDPSHPLLQELVRRAPGTYNHSMSVASMAESAAESIGANGLLVRVGAYFHDIGKMLKPQYFIENVQAGGESRHEHLAPAMSTLIIIGHVKDGVDLAQQYNLPQQLIDFIEQHHGTTLVEYFYHEAARQAGDSPDRKTDAEESSFRYPGPKPQSKEAGVMMMADACESASRALTDPTPKRLERLVSDILMKRLLDNQFSQCDLTLAELRIIEKSISKSLIGIYHGRIKYPEVNSA